MGDVDEIIEYIKSLKKGFDKDLFQSKIEELVSLRDSNNLEYEDFYTLFKIWLNLSIPITKWTSLGVCLVPQERVNKRTVDYTLRWILANYESQKNLSRIAFVLDWLTAAMDSDSIDMIGLDTGYELFYTMLKFEVLAGHAIKLVYTLTKPADVTRRRVLEIMEYAKPREGKKNLYKQLQVLLGLFKSYKPECVPEDVPSISIHTAFKKINVALLARFKNSQNNRDSLTKNNQRLFWVNPLNSDVARNKKVDPLVPNLEFINIGAKQYADCATQKNYHDFSEPVSLLQYSLTHRMSQPARLRALLCNETGMMLLAIASNSEHAFLSYDLNNLLFTCFLETSPYSYTEKQNLLHRLAILQSTIMQGLPVVTRFLAQFLNFWNEIDFFSEILQLVEWVNVQEVDQICEILDTLAKIYHRSQPIEQCAILKAMTTMYTNIVFASTRDRQYFMSMNLSENNFSEVLTKVAAKITLMCEKGLQVSPNDMRVVYSCTRSAVGRCWAAERALEGAGAGAGAGEGAGAGAAAVAGARLGVGELALALPLITPSAVVLDSVIELICAFKDVATSIKSKFGRKELQQNHLEQIQVFKAFTSDLKNCLCEEFMTNRKNGLIFNNLHPQLVSKLSDLIPDIDTKLGLRSHLAFAMYTYMKLQTDNVRYEDADNKVLFNTVIENEFNALNLFVRTAIPEMLS